MIAAVHLAEPGPAKALRVLRTKAGDDVPGLRFAEVHATARFGRSLLPSPTPGRVALVSVWDDDAALDAFEASAHPLARAAAGGWSVRLEPLRQSGAVAAMPELAPPQSRPVDPEEPVVVLTYGRTRLRRAKPFLAANRIATVGALDHPGLVASTGLTRPPRTIGTFSVWRTAREMEDYAYSAAHPSHLQAITGMAEHDFHRESLFARFRPYRSQGRWEGRDPLAA